MSIIVVECRTKNENEERFNLNKKNKLFWLTLIIVFSLIPAIGQAAELESTTSSQEIQRSDHVSLSPEEDSEDFELELQSSSNSLIMTWGTYIGHHGSFLMGGGYTDTYNIVGNVGVTVFIQKWENGKWNDVALVVYRSWNNTDYVSGSNSYSPAKGSYYRTRASHWASNNGISESKMSVSPSIYYN